MRLFLRDLPRLLLAGALTTLGRTATAQTPARDTFPTPAPFERELGGGCDKRLPALSGVRCLETELGWIVSDDRQRTAEILSALRTAAAKFRKAFGRPVPRGLIIAYVSDDVNLAPEEDRQRLGAHWLFPIALDSAVTYPGRTDSTALAESRAQWTETTHQALRQRWPQLSETKLQDTVAQLWAERVHYMLHDHSWYTVHEIAHRWFEEAFTWKPAWNPAWTRPRPPDWSGRDQWLNEGAGILMEGPYWQRVRQEKLARLYRQDTSLVVPLDTLFASPHPLNGPHGMSSGQYDRVYFDVFYSQISGVLTFLIAQSRDSTVIGAIAAAEERGTTVAEWLKAEGSRYGLPATVAALDRDWRRWFEQQILAKY